MATRRARGARAAVDRTFEELYRGHRDSVYRAALRELGNAHDAEDVTQAAFVDAYRAVLRGTRPQSPRAWLLAISENVRRRRFRTAQRRPREEPMDADSPPAAELPSERAGALAEALASLPPEQRRAFVLRELAGLSYDEIAGEVDSTVPAVQMLLFRARRSLRAALEPPTVATRRPGFVPPLPGWMAALLSRVEIAGLTPRAAGALGAAVLTVGGASVAVPDSQADGRSLPRPATMPSVARTADPAARATRTSTAGARTVVRTTPRAQRSQPVAIPPSIVSEPAPAPAPAARPAVPGPESLRIPLVVEVVTGPVELAAPHLPLDSGTGAAGAAGASAPPAPVPSLPLPTLPPVP